MPFGFPIPPTWVFGLTTASIYVALFGLFSGRRLVSIPFYWVAGSLGLFVGQAIGDHFHLQYLMLGDLHLAEATAGCWAALLLAKRRRLW